MGGLLLTSLWVSTLFLSTALADRHDVSKQISYQVWCKGGQLTKVYVSVKCMILHEHQLITDMFSSYPSVLIRPVKKEKLAVEVAFGMTLQAFELDEVSEILKSVAWLNYAWKDISLTWNETRYGGVKSVRIPINKIWSPDIQPYNEQGPQQLTKTLTVVYSDGTVNWVPTTHIGTSCTIDLTYFPFDTQHCTLKFGSWTYDGNKVNLTAREDKIDTSHYTPNKAWDLLETPAERSVKLYECCPEPYIDIMFTVSMKRRSSFFMYAYVSPAIILSLLGAAIFVLPPGSAQKTILGGALLICYGLFFIEIGQVLPPVHVGAPIIDRYYTAMYAMLAASVFLSAIISNMLRRTSPPSAILNKVVAGCLGRLVCLSPAPYTGLKRGDEVEICDLREEGGAEDGHRSREWLVIGAVLDRFFLVCYLVLTVILTFGILIQYA